MLYTQVCTPVNGRYQVEVTLVSYSNPSGRCQGCAVNTDSEGVVSHSCCDDFSRFSDRACDSFRQCDVYFIFCLRPTDSTGMGCSNYTNKTSDVFGNLMSGNLGQGLSNQLFPGLLEPYTVSVMHIIFCRHTHTVLLHKFVAWQHCSWM